MDPSTPQPGRNGQMSASPTSNLSSPTIRRTFVQTAVRLHADDDISACDVVSDDEPCLGSGDDCACDVESGNQGDADLVPSARWRVDRTVLDMSATSTLYHKAQNDQLLRKLGRLGGWTRGALDAPDLGGLWMRPDGVGRRVFEGRRLRAWPRRTCSWGGKPNSA